MSATESTIEILRSDVEQLVIDSMTVGRTADFGEFDKKVKELTSAFFKTINVHLSPKERPTNYLRHLRTIALRDVDHLLEKDKKYGSSWKKRGGTGAFFTFVRKWDRIELQAKMIKYDIFEQLGKEMKEGSVDGLLDDIGDLRRYLMLVEAEMMEQVLERGEDEK